VHTTFGVEINREAISIVHTATDDDGNLKIKTLEEFVDSQTYLESMKAVHEAMARK
jgi:hypothetical protein